MSGSSQDDPFPECGTRTRKQFCTKMYSSLTSFNYFFSVEKFQKRRQIYQFNFLTPPARVKRISLQSYKGVLVCKQSIAQNRLVSPQKQLFMVCFLQVMQEFGVFDEFLYFSVYKTLVALRDVFGYSDNILG